MRRPKWSLAIFHFKARRLVCFLALVYSFAGTSFAAEMVCGQLNGHVIKVQREYIAFWAEYEGKSSWEKGFTNNKKGCGANLVSVPMIMTWPEMAPANHVTYFKQALEFEGLSVSLGPFRRSGIDLRRTLEFFLSATPPQWIDLVRFDEGVGLYYVDGNDRVFDGRVNKYFWLETNGEISVVFECLWLTRENRLYTCEGSYVLKELGVLVDVRFTPEKMKDWSAIVRAVEKFVVGKIKK
jgi:hypothetical protein